MSPPLGILGTGQIGRALATHLVKAGYDVLLANSRGPESLAPMVRELGPKAHASTVRQAAAAPIVFLAIVWDKLAGALAGLPAFDGRIVVDATNALVVTASGMRVADTGGRTSSEVVAGLVPGARVVKAFNTLPAAVLAGDPHEPGGRRVLFLSGDDSAAKAELKKLIDAIGFAPIDLGGLVATGRLLQPGGGPLGGVNLVRLG